VADGAYGPVGRQLDEHFGLPAGCRRHEWAVGCKAVVQLTAEAAARLKPGTVFHTFGYPEPEIFGFMYAYPEGVVSLGIFVPSWWDSPSRTSYRPMQHWMQHPYLWKFLQGGTLRSWGAKSLGEAGRRGEPHLTGNGYARIGEGSGTTNILAGSGVDEGWFSGVLLAEAVIELLKAKKPFTKQNLDAAYVARRRKSWLDQESKVAARSREGFSRGLIPGMLGMGLAGMTDGLLHFPARSKTPQQHIPSFEKYYCGRLEDSEIESIRQETTVQGTGLHDALLDKTGWPAVPYDGQLLVSHQDALLLGGKVQAAAGYANHIIFKQPSICKSCREKVCIEACSGQAITPGPDGVPAFDREKCVHCGACIWNCSKSDPQNAELTNVEFRAGSGGLHSAEN
jgi:electron-transferring-flavoprotein dehydrogenase